MPPRDELSAKERDVAVLVWQGFTNPEISAIIGVSEQMVKNHLSKIFDKLGVWSRLELALYISNHGGPAWDDKAPVEKKKATETQIRIV